MKTRTRLERLVRRVGGLPPPGELSLVVAVPVGSGMADGLPAGVHFKTDGRVATVVSDGPAPDTAVLAGLKERLASSGFRITAHPT
jgi:hypothetical protein